MPSGACSCKVVDGNEIAASWPRNSLITVLCKGPAASGKGRGARSAANPPGSIPPFRYEKSTSVGAEVPNSFNTVDVTCLHKGTNFSLNRKYFIKIAPQLGLKCLHLELIQDYICFCKINTNLLLIPDDTC